MDTIKAMMWLKDLLEQAQDIDVPNEDYVAEDVAEMASHIKRISTFDDAMVLTQNEGLVLTFKDNSRIALDFNIMSDAI